MRIVVAGCGGISQAWFKAACGRSDVEIVGLVDLRRDAAEKRAADFNLPNAAIGTKMKEIVTETRPDVLFNCTIPEAHASVTLEALKCGCHVLCEKPLADTMANARKMVTAARRAGKVLAVMQNRRFDLNIRRARAFIESGVIGKVTTVQSNFFIGAHFGGFRDRMEHVLLLDMAIHTFDAARLITGADPVSVLCHEWNPEGSWYDHDASAVAIFEMTGGIVYTYQGSWCAEGHSTPWEAQWRVIGTKGTMLWNGAAVFSAQVATPNGTAFYDARDVPVPEYPACAQSGGHGGLICDFLDCLKTGRTPETVATDNIRSLAMVHGTIASAKQGRRIRIAFKED